MQRLFRVSLGRAIRAIGVISTLALASTASAQSDQWSTEVVLMDNTGNHFAPVHATLLPSGDVMMIGFTQALLSPTASAGMAALCYRNGTTTALFTPTPSDPTTSPVTPAVLPTFTEVVTYPANPQYCYTEGGCGVTACESDTYFCSGHTLLANGDLIVVGGLREKYLLPSFFAAGGTDYSSIWDWTASPSTAAWSQVTPLFAGVPAGAYTQSIFSGRERYYPTAMRMPTGDVMIIGGSQLLQATGASPVKNLVAELFTPPATYNAFPGVAPDSVFNVDYTHMFVLPTLIDGNDVILLGDDAVPVFFNSQTNSWTEKMKMVGDLMVPDVRPLGPGASVVTDPNKGGSTVMLPIRQSNGSFGYKNGSILTTGGQMATGATAGYGDYADIYDVAGGLGQWTTQIALQNPRHHPSTVLLPDGQILLTGGHLPGSTTPVPQQGEYVNPRTSFSSSLGTADPSAVPRGYHAVTLLLPDGRVLVGGGRSAGSQGSTALERASIQYLYPPYMFRSRPQITSAPSVITSGTDGFNLITDRKISEVVLVGLGSMTHSIDMNQRHLQLRISQVAYNVQTGAQLSIVRPPNGSGRQAPPGYYMLFALGNDDARTPSEAVIVRVAP